MKKNISRESKSRSKAKASMLTLICKLVSSFVATITNIILVNLIINGYGPEVNGLTSSLNHFVTMFSVLEGGITTAAIVASYKPIIDKNYEELNSILSYTRKFLNKIAAIFVITSLVAGGIYIAFIDSPEGYWMTWWIVFFSVITSCISMCIIPQYTILLHGFNEEYIILFINTIIKIFTFLISLIVVLNHERILYTFVANLCGVILNVLILHCYQKSKYPQINYNATATKLVHGTKDVALQKVLNIIFDFTDVFLISIAISLTMASVYNLNNQIYSSIYTIVIAVILAPNNSIAILFREDKMRFKKVFETYRIVAYIVIAVLLTTTGCMIKSFFELYISVDVQVEYFNPVLNILFFSFFFLRAVSSIYGGVINLSGQFCLQNKQLIIAMITNISMSILLMIKYETIGIIAGSVLAMMIMLFMNMKQACKYVIQRSFLREIILVIIYYAVSAILVYVGGDIIIGLKITSYLQWVSCALIVMSLSVVFWSVFSLLFQYKQLKELFIYIKKYIHKKSLR
ncbi:MAG: hypothetical protein J6A73_04025 [Lachnospiraceae bacterium]|nr:hypothetical protein [Lachnospiraceae bacterium]